MLNIDNMSFSFPGNTLFTEVNLLLPKNRITLLTGSNGSGKTTFCRLISGLQSGYSGLIEPPQKMLYLRQSAETNLLAATPDLDLKIWNYSRPPINIQETKEILNWFDLTAKADQPVWELSGGEQQRLALSSLLLHPQHFWLLDEPAAGLDGKQQQNFLQLLKNHKSGALIVTHREILYQSVIELCFKITDKKIIEI